MDFNKGTTQNTKKPNQNVRDTSKEAYESFKISDELKSKSRKQLVHECLESIEPATRKMIALELGLFPSDITQGIKDLIEEGKIIESFKATCKASKGNTKVFYLEILDTNSTHKDSI